MSKQVHLTTDAFCRILAEYFSLDTVAINESSRLDEDLGLDSLQLLEIAMLLEDLAGHEIPDDLFTSLKTLGDIYHYYNAYTDRAIDARI